LSSLLGLFDDSSEALWAFLGLFCHFVRLSKEGQKAVEALLKEFWIHIFGAAGEEEVDFDALAVFKPFRSSLSFELEVVLACADLYLERFDLDRVSLGFGRLLLFIFLVLELAVVGDLCDRRVGVRRDLDEVEACLVSAAKSLADREDAVILARGTDDADFRRFDLVVYSCSVFTQCVLPL